MPNAIEEGQRPLIVWREVASPTCTHDQVPSSKLDLRLLVGDLVAVVSKLAFLHEAVRSITTPTDPVTRLRPHREFPTGLFSWAQAPSR